MNVKLNKRCLFVVRVSTRKPKRSSQKNYSNPVELFYISFGRSIDNFNATYYFESDKLRDVHGTFCSDTRNS